MRTLSLYQRRLFVVQLCLSTAFALRWNNGAWVSLAAVTASSSSTANKSTSSPVSTSSKGPWWKGLDLGGDNNNNFDSNRKQRKQELKRKKDGKKKQGHRIPQDDEDEEDFAEEAEEADAFPAEDVLSPLQLEPMLQIPCSLELVPHDESNDNNNHPNSQPKKKFPIQTYCDTGAQRTVLSWEAAQRLGVAHLIDRRYKGHATGVGLCRVVGRIPAHAVRLHFSSLDGDNNRNKNSELVVTMPAITVLESTGTPGVELLLGLDFLRDTQAVIDLQQEELRLTSCGRNTNTDQRPATQARIPFIQPRSSPPLDFDSCTSNEKDHHEDNHQHDDKLCKSGHHRHNYGPKKHQTEEEEDQSYLDEDDNSEYESADPDEEVDMSWL